MIILGIRPCIKKSGFSWAILEIEDDKIGMISNGRVPGSKKSMGERLTEIRGQLISALSIYEGKEKYGFLESHYAGTNNEGREKLFEARGMTKQLLFELGFNIIELSNHAIYECVPGIDKTEMASYIRQKTGIKVLINDSSIMAFALALTGWELLKKPKEVIKVQEIKVQEINQKGSYKSSFGLKWG